MFSVKRARGLKTLGLQAQVSVICSGRCRQHPRATSSQAVHSSSYYRVQFCSALESVCISHPPEESDSQVSGLKMNSNALLTEGEQEFLAQEKSITDAVIGVIAVAKKENAQIADGVVSASVVEACKLAVAKTQQFKALMQGTCSKVSVSARSNRGGSERCLLRALAGLQTEPRWEVCRCVSFTALGSLLSLNSFKHASMRSPCSLYASTL